MTYVIAQPCVDVKDKACIDECPVDCIYEGERSLYIHPDECVDCGACEPVCPVEAIYYEDDVPAQWSAFLQRQRGVLRHDRIAGRCRQTRHDPDRSPAGGCPPAAGRGLMGFAPLGVAYPWDAVEPLRDRARATPTA